MGDSSTSALYAGGDTPGFSTNTEDWNGTGWTEVADLNQARRNHAASGTSSAGFIFSGSIPPSTNNATSSEEWSGSTITTKVLTD